MDNIYYSTVFFIITVLTRYEVKYLIDQKYDETYKTIIHYKLINEGKQRIKRTLTLDQINDHTIAINGAQYDYDDLTIGLLVRLI